MKTFNVDDFLNVSEEELEEKVKEDKINLNLNFDSKIVLFSILHLVLYDVLEILDKQNDLSVCFGGLNIAKTILDQMPDNLIKEFFENIDVDREEIESIFDYYDTAKLMIQFNLLGDLDEE